jgi:ornithine--oxo-acid transaminase
MEIDPDKVSAGTVVRRLIDEGVLTKDTHRNTIRFAPPLIIDEGQIDWVADRLVDVLGEVASEMVSTVRRTPA